MGTILRTQPDTSWEDANCLIHVLHDWGIHYLVVDDVAQNAALCPQGQSMSAIELLQRLARCSYPRVRDACIALFLLHPELTPTILTALKISTEFDYFVVCFAKFQALYPSWENGCRGVIHDALAARCTPTPTRMETQISSVVVAR